ncbi:hypothetical protein B6D12_07585 [Gilliamella apicola]|nr:hypothetical protein B5S41_11605 [Gilliamella apicola]OTP92093.1 hypothetical protein B6D05_12965 [Gilliamella apicola]OTP93266.1 hypothetical protein B6D13_10535 [Gilliamella apicola]OTP98970.1 hypothetical protein B6D07_12540 [Gilliamella apicola]OTQ05314.1 hypothetical protein B6D12_07585 [Gilliamella apicola]
MTSLFYVAIITKPLFYSLLVLYLLQSYKIEQKSEISYEKITSLVFFALVLLNTINERAIGVLL